MARKNSRRRVRVQMPKRGGRAALAPVYDLQRRQGR